jgi:hypothetical protein
MNADLHRMAVLDKLPLCLHSLISVLTVCLVCLCLYAHTNTALHCVRSPAPYNNQTTHFMFSNKFFTFLQNDKRLLYVTIHNAPPGSQTSKPPVKFYKT